MVSAAKAFEKEPPKKPLTNLKRIVKDFQWRYKDRNKTDQVVRFCAEAPDFATAVRRAVEARDENGKHHNHQSKVDITARRKFGAKIIKRKNQIMNVVTGNFEAPTFTKFDAIHDLLDDIKPRGIGPVTVYDVAVRLGAYLEVEPKQVYMHAGVREGLKALGAALQRLGAKEWAPDPDILWDAYKLKRVPLSLFPEALRTLPADEVEDILCTYREVFDDWNR